MNYLSKFDSDGKRVASYPLDKTITKEQYTKLLDEGYIEISEEDWNYYVGNKGQGANGTGYIYDSTTGKPISAPPHVPTKEEKLATLDSQYETDKAALMEYFTAAVFSKNEEQQNELREELKNINKEYSAARAKLKGEN